MRIIATAQHADLVAAFFVAAFFFVAFFFVTFFFVAFFFAAPFFLTTTRFAMLSSPSLGKKDRQA
jgi:hypothetical protein